MRCVTLAGAAVRGDLSVRVHGAHRAQNFTAIRQIPPGGQPLGTFCTLRGPLEVLPGAPQPACPVLQSCTFENLYLGCLKS